MEARIGLATLLKRLPDLQPSDIDTPNWKQTITLRGQKTLPATW
jgi:cytochrome P450|tara:strand:+ start:168 stop:299 length:132 start_codon:yes stop_codon:yes gene_type:complete